MLCGYDTTAVWAVTSHTPTFSMSTLHKASSTELLIFLRTTDHSFRVSRMLDSDFRRRTGGGPKHALYSLVGH